MGVAAYAAKPVDSTPGDAGGGRFGWYDEMEISADRDCISPVSGGNALDNPASCLLFAYGNNICPGQARAISRGGRLTCRYNPITFLRDGRAAGISVTRDLQASRRPSGAVKLSPRHGFIRLRKLLI